jgi:hypothetical protein
VIKRMILEAVRNIEGVNGIVDHIQTDPDLEIAVARALATDPKTRGISPGAINIRSHLGAVSLTGFLPVGFDRGEVRRVVHEVPGVRVAEDRLQD